MADLSLRPVSVGIYTLLNVAALTDLATGGISDSPAQGTAFPFVWFELREREARGFGAGGLPEVNLRVHTFIREDTAEGLKEAYDVSQQAVTLLKDKKVTVAGYTHAGSIFYDETVPLLNQVLNDVKVHELVSMFRFFVEEN